MRNEELPKVSAPFYAPINPEFTKKELIPTIQRIENYINKIKRYNPELGNELEENLKSLTSQKNQNLYEQMNMNDKLEGMLMRIDDIYNSRILKTKIIERIDANSDSFQENFMSTTPEIIIEILTSIKDDIEKVVELDDIKEVLEKFNEFRAFCIAIYFRKKDGNILNDEVFNKIIGDFNDRQGLDTYIQGLNIENNKEYNRIMANSDESFEYLNSPDIWRIMADYLKIPIQAPVEVIKKDENSTSLVVPNNHRKRLVNGIIYYLQLLFSNLFSVKNRQSEPTSKKDYVIDTDVNPKQLAIEDQRPILEKLLDIYNTEGSVSFLYELGNSLRDKTSKRIEFTEEMYKAYEKRLIEQENLEIPNNINLFEYKNSEDLWLALFQMVLYEDKQDPDKITFKDEEGRQVCIMLEDDPIEINYQKYAIKCTQYKYKFIYSCNDEKITVRWIVDEGSIENADKFIYEHAYSIHILHFLCEVDKLFGTNCIAKYADEIMNNVTRDEKNICTKIVTDHNRMYFFAKRVLSSLMEKIPNIEQRVMFLNMKRKEYYAGLDMSSSDRFRNGLISTPEDVVGNQFNLEPNGEVSTKTIVGTNLDDENPFEGH